MHIKRFEAATLQEAIEQIKRELGPDALVLSTRRIRRDRGLFGLFARPVVEVTAGVDRDLRRGPTGVDHHAGRGRASVDHDAGRGRASVDHDAGRGRASVDHDARRGPTGVDHDARRGRADASTPPDRSPPATGADPSWSELRLSRALIEPLESEVRALRVQLERLAAREPSPSAWEDERAELHRLVRELALSRGGQEGGSLRSSGAASLLASGVAPVHVREIDEAVLAQSGSDPREQRGALRAELAGRLERGIVLPRADLEPPVALLVGAPGVGKTTSLAKLAARERDERELAIVSTDGYRIGAEEQLRTFASLLRAPFATALSPDDLARVVGECGRRRVWVDTAGRSRRDREGLGELVALRDRLGAQVRVHLVVSATTRESDLRAELARFAPLRPDALIATRMDETTRTGELANLVLDPTTPPLAWWGTGQRVPEDLALPEPEAWAELLLERAA